MPIFKNNNHLLRAAQLAFPDFDLRVHDENDAYNYCERRGLFLHETEFTKESGQYLHRNGSPVIILNKYLKLSYRKWVLYHECGHDIYHSPLACNFSLDMKRTVEKQANIIASMLLMPTIMLASLSDYEIIFDYNYPPEIVQFRRKLYFEMLTIQ